MLLTALYLQTDRRIAREGAATNMENFVANRIGLVLSIKKFNLPLGFPLGRPNMYRIKSIEHVSIKKDDCYHEDSLSSLWTAI